MTPQETLPLIIATLTEIMPERAEQWRTITPESTLTQLALDSLATMELVGALEDETGHEFEDEDLAKVRTVQDLITLAGSGSLQ